MNVEPITLEGRYVRLEPLSLSHHAQLCEVGLDDELWRWVPTVVKTEDDVRKFIEKALSLRDEGSALPFATIERSSGRAIGSTRYLNIDRANRRVEIGSTWVGTNWQRTPINTEAKYLMLCHAFEQLSCIRVELKTDALNEKSRNAILRLGAKQEGIFRNHMVMPGGRIRDSVYFSIIDSEWPTIKANLENKLTRNWSPTQS
ncbi:MAG: GNAT family protein [Chloroflexota bacterium]